MIRADVDAVVRAHRTLLDRLTVDCRAALSDDHITRPSKLPGWTVGHVLAHLVLDAESMARPSIAAESGVVGKQYPGGASDATASIDHKAQATAAQLLDDLRRSIGELEDLWTRPDRGWDGRVETLSGAVVPESHLPLRRWREVEVRMGDLGLVELGCDGPSAWSEEYVRRDVRVMTLQWSARGSMGMNALPREVVRLDDRSRLAWLLGRQQVEGISAGGFL